MSLLAVSQLNKNQTLYNKKLKCFQSLSINKIIKIPVTSAKRYKFCINVKYFIEVDVFNMSSLFKVETFETDRD
jgi:hypothetical protein